MIYAKDLSTTEQIFSHKDDNGKTYTIAVDRLRRKLRDKKPEEHQVDHELARIFMEKSGLEQHRLERLVRMSEETFKQLLPGVALLFKDETWVLADGNHQYVAASIRKYSTIRLLIARRQEWAPFIVKDYNAEFSGFSGII